MSDDVCWNALVNQLETARARIAELEENERLAKAIILVAGEKLAKELARIAELEAQLTERSSVVTQLCLAIDPDCMHGPETDKLCAYAVRQRELLGIAGQSFVKLCVRIEQIVCGCRTLTNGIYESSPHFEQCRRCVALHDAECIKNNFATDFAAMERKES